MTQRAKSEPEQPPVDWSRISPRPGPTSPIARPDPAATSAVSPIDVRILRERELEELGRLYDACVEWHDRTNPNLRNGHDRTLAQAIARARGFR
jgi:hypothetical protein